MALLLTETGESDSGLTTAAVLLGQLDLHALEHLLVVALQGGHEDTITIDDDEAELVVVLEQGQQGLSVEIGLAFVGEDVDRSERSQVNLDLLLGFAVFEQDDTAEDAETVRRSVFVQLQLLTG